MAANFFEKSTGLFKPSTLGLTGNSDSSGGGASAQSTFADLTRDSWYTFMHDLGAPQEDKLIEYATDPAVISQSMAQASQDVTGAFQRQAGNTDRRLKSLGLMLNPDEQVAADRSANLAMGIADADAQNRARDQTIARRKAVIGMPAPNIGSLT